MSDPSTQAQFQRFTWGGGLTRRELSAFSYFSKGIQTRQGGLAPSIYLRTFEGSTDQHRLLKATVLWYTYKFGEFTSVKTRFIQNITRVSKSRRC